jgi:hypothetical protein
MAVHLGICSNGTDKLAGFQSKLVSCGVKEVFPAIATVACMDVNGNASFDAGGHPAFFAIVTSSHMAEPGNAPPILAAANLSCIDLD